MKVVKEEYFTAINQHEFLDANGYPVTSDDLKAYAKMHTDAEGRLYYYIRQETNSDPYDPFDRTGKDTRFDKNLNQVRYKKVNRQTYEMYKNYLKTANKAIYSNVIRGFI